METAASGESNDPFAHKHETVPGFRIDYQFEVVGAAVVM
jgi:hypothetical protein